MQDVHWSGLYGTFYVLQNSVPFLVKKNGTVLSYHMKKDNQENKIGEKGYKCYLRKKYHMSLDKAFETSLVIFIDILGVLLIYFHLPGFSLIGLYYQF